MQSLIHLYCETDSNFHEYLISTINVIIENIQKTVQQSKQIRDSYFKDVITKRLDAIQEFFCFQNLLFIFLNFIIKIKFALKHSEPIY